MCAMSDAARCLDCGYLLRGLRQHRCPECGRGFVPDDPSTYATEMPRPFWLTVCTRVMCCANAIYIAIAMLVCLAGSVADTSPGEQRWAACLGIWLVSVGIVNLLAIQFAQRCSRYALVGVWAYNAALLLAGFHDACSRLRQWGPGAACVDVMIDLCVPLVIAAGALSVVTAQRRSRAQAWH
jgi:hypothetical protein